MCGIAGFISSDPKSEADLNHVYGALASRGPDVAGGRLFNREANGWNLSDKGVVGLLHTRLSIRDLSLKACQPMSNEDGSVWLVYNGEIYGWENERDELVAQGHLFRSQTDSEFIIHGYEAWGESVLDHLRGMFAFAILDLRQQRLFCARDRLGKKPFYYGVGPTGFGFASSLKAVVGLVGQLSLDSDAIDAYLAHRYIPAPKTLFKSAWKLPAGFKFSVPLKNLSTSEIVPTSYWSPRPNNSGGFDEKFTEAVSLRLVSDRPVGLFLSGGIDSQAIALALSRLPQKNAVRAFTAGFPQDARYDETADAVQVAQRLELTHTLLPVEMSAGDLDKIVASLDEPFADPSAIPTWYLCRAATQEVKVALTGDGGDELFAGYKRYAAHLRSANWNFMRSGNPRSHRFESKNFVSKKTVTGKIRRTLLDVGLSWKESYALRFSGIDPLTRAFLQPDKTDVRVHYWRLPELELSPIEWMLECDRLNYLPDYILKKGDLCSMAHGLELRNPLLDQRLFEFVQSIPSKQRFTTPAKGVLRNYLGQVPQGGKRGFNPPLEQWFKQPSLVERIRDLPEALEELTGGCLVAERLDEMIQGYFRGELQAEIIWQLLVLAISLKSFWVPQNQPISDLK